MTEFTSEMGVHLEQCNASDILVARAAWVSNHGTDAREKDSERVPGLINFLMREKHMSPFEHGDFTFFIDCPIFVAREFMRHRTCRFNEVSGRYKELEAKFYVPSPDRPLVQEGPIGRYHFSAGTEMQVHHTTKWVKWAYKGTWAAYQGMIKLGVANEVARIVLPVGIYTQFYVSVNPRNLMHFLSLRNEDQALYEIREVAAKMEAIFKDQMPLTYEAYLNNKETA